MGQTVDISRAPKSNSITITTRKTKSSRHDIAKAQDRRTVRASSGPRRVAKVVSSQVAGYRPDLLRPALARSNRLLHTSSARSRKEAPKRKLRGKKLAEAEAAKAESD
jgi:hypothetical protein